MNIFDWTGPDFLKFYGVGLAVAVCLWWLIQWALRGPGDLPLHIGEHLTAYDAAYLRAGERGLLQAAAMSLHRRELIRARSTVRLLTHQRAVGARDGNLDEVEQWLLGEIPPEGLPVRRLYGLRVPAAQLVTAVFGEDLVMRVGRMWGVRLASAAPLLMLWAAGVIKVNIGLSRNRPVEYLLALLAGVTLLLFVLSAQVSRRTRRGDRVFRELRKRHAAMRHCAARRTVDVSPFDAALATGLFGVRMFAMGEFAPMANALQPAPAQGGSSDSSCSACGGGGCGGGGGGGCGGCGGGGH